MPESMSLKSLDPGIRRDDGTVINQRFLNLVVVRCGLNFSGGIPVKASSTSKFRPTIPFFVGPTHSACYKLTRYPGITSARLCFDTLVPASRCRAPDPQGSAVH